MVRIGWMQDPHNKSDTNNDSPGAQQRMVEDYNYLVNKGCDTLVMTGDMVHPNAGGDIPHAGPEEYEHFWDLIDQTDDPDLLEYCVPGNHDVPLSTYLESDPRCKLTERVEFEADGVTMILLNTQQTGWTTGSRADGGGQGGAGTEFCRTSYRDMKWVEEQLDDAGSNAKLIMPHAPTYPINDSEYVPPEESNGALGEGALYWITTNYQFNHDILKQFNKVVEPTSHVYGHSDEGTQVTDGVHYVWKKHYYNHPNDEVRTFCYIDIDSTGCTITSVDHATKSETVITDVTF